MKKKYLLLKKRLECKNRYPIYDQNGSKMAKICTQFMKIHEKPYPLGPHIPIYMGGALDSLVCNTRVEKLDRFGLG